MIASPFSCRLLSLGSSGTFPIQGLTRVPPTVKVHDPQSPLRTPGKMTEKDNGIILVKQNIDLCNFITKTFVLFHLLFTAVFWLDSKLCTSVFQGRTCLEICLFCSVCKFHHLEFRAGARCSERSRNSECIGSCNCQDEEQRCNSSEICHYGCVCRARGV